jgi:membrane protein YdbS with pleckstrin-like domain
MGKSTIIIIYVLLMVAVVVAADLLFFRHRFRERLIANIAIVLAFLVFYLIFLRHK